MAVIDEWGKWGTFSEAAVRGKGSSKAFRLIKPIQFLPMIQVQRGSVISALGFERVCLAQ